MNIQITSDSRNIPSKRSEKRSGTLFRNCFYVNRFELRKLRFERRTSENRCEVRFPRNRRTQHRQQLFFGWVSGNRFRANVGRSLEGRHRLFGVRLAVSVRFEVLAAAPVQVQHSREKADDGGELPFSEKSQYPKGNTKYHIFQMILNHLFIYRE